MMRRQFAPFLMPTIYIDFKLGVKVLFFYIVWINPLSLQWN